MTYTLIIFPPTLDTPCTLRFDDSGVVITSRPVTHPTGRLGQGFDIPPGTPNGHGVRLTVGSTTIQRGYLFLNDGQLPWPWPADQTAAFAGDDFPAVATSGPPPFGPVQIVGDHFESGGRRWTWRMTTGFLDYQVFLDKGDLPSLLKQNQDLGARGRRVFLNIINITDFNPDAYGQAFFDRLPEFCALNAEYEQYVEFDILPDTQYRGWSLGKCQEFWARVNDALDRAGWNHFRSLTNEFDHGGNLVGRPDDYARPAYSLVSQGSAVQDATPPCPALGTGAGWGFWEWHAADPPNKFSHEYFIWQGLSTGAIKPCVISEHGRRITEQNADENYIRSLTYASLANGSGLTVHTENGKYSQLLGPRQAACVKTAMAILGAA